MASTYKVNCPECLKGVEVVRTILMPKKEIYIYSCGHVGTREKVQAIHAAPEQEDQLEQKDPYQVESLDKKTPFPFQVECIKFAEQANLRCLIADEMGLGKTIEALCAMKLHPEATPFLVFCKSSLKEQWAREIVRWCGPEYVPQILAGGKEVLFAGFKSYVISLDMLRRLTGFEDQIKAVGIKTIIIDECQLIKNTQAARTVLLRRCSRVVPHVMALSGTYIKNDASEGFSIFNMLYPERYPNRDRFIREECDWYWNSYSYKVGGLRDPEGFRERTKDFIIRRTRTEVLPELPVVTRQFRFSDLGKEVEKAYLATLKDFQAYYDRSPGEHSNWERESNIMAFISKMRHLVGISKINPCVDHLTEFLESTERKIAIFVHHKDVGVILGSRIAALCEELKLPPPLKLTSDMDSGARQATVDRFSNNGTRVLVASTLASGEGLNLQACSDCVLVERQWNPANEEQVEGRFIRIGQKSSKVTATYLVAVGTVDEFFSEIVERKRQYVSSTLDGTDCPWDESSLMKELAEVLASKGSQRWKL